MCTKHINIRHHFLRVMFKKKDMGDKYIRSEYNTAGIMAKNFSESKNMKHAKRIIERELW